MIRTVQAARYVTPLREGGSLPAIVEADDLGLYVLKFRGAGQGTLALVAELVAGEIGRRVGLRVPEIVLVNVDAALGRNEPDQEIRDLLRASIGVNIALDFLPGSLAFDPAAAMQVDAATASAAVWLDAFVTNVDRTARNTNLLWWHKQLYLIDHGAALYVHHNWPDSDAAFNHAVANPFRAIRNHVLLANAVNIEEFAGTARASLSETDFEDILTHVPDDWLASRDPVAQRERYVSYLSRRLQADTYVQEAIHARAQLL